MSSTLLPFLYQTRTLQRAFRGPLALAVVRSAHSQTSRRRQTVKHDNSIPFEWDPEDDRNDGLQQPSTITPSEAEVFKGIFDEIAQGKMPAARKRPAAFQKHPQDSTDPSVAVDGAPVSGAATGHRNGMARSIVEQARVTEFREKFLGRYPKSLRNAAQVALGLYELEPRSSGSGKSQMMELDEANESKWAERAKYDRARLEERERVDALMKACQTDDALWKVMEEEVFSLPAKLGIAQGVKSRSITGQRDSKGKRTAKATNSETLGPKTVDDEKRIMDVHGPLYSHFINTALGIFDTAFAHPSPFAFRILPRIKELGLPSYVLGVSTPFYTQLARMHWNQFGDANSALDMLQEMNSAGLYADDEVTDLLAKIRDHLHGCTWGAQGPFVMAMMESPPYDGALTQRLEDMDKSVKRSLYERTRDYAQ